MTPAPRIVVHAGADMPADRATLATLRAAAVAGLARLRAGGSAASAAVAAVALLEDDPRLNAGRGSVLNADGDVETDASVVDGTADRFAAVAGLRGIANPVRAAEALLASGAGPVLLVGEGARRFALGAGLEERDLVTDEQRAFWQDVRDGRAGGARSTFTGRPLSASDTVGAIVVADGRLAAAGSTGGMLMKLPGRVGDAAVLGAGIYADEDAAVLCSGHGEATIELSLALRVALRTRDGTVADAVRWGIGTAERRKDMRGGIVAYTRASDTVAAVTNASSFPVVTATADGDAVVPPVATGA